MQATDGGTEIPPGAAGQGVQGSGAAAGAAGETARAVEAAGETGGAAGETGGAAGETGGNPAVRASDRERDAVLQRVQQAFAEGRLDDAEFDERMRAALIARTRADLDALLADLPADGGAPGPAPVIPGRGPGRFAIALKSSVRRSGRWRVPERYTTVVYKGAGWLDLRAAELSGPVTTFLAVAYKSRVMVLVPPGVRVEMAGFGITQGPADEEDPDYRLPADAPVIHVRGIAYKGTVEITTVPRGAPPSAADPPAPR